MSFGIRYDIPVPIQMYDAVHAELLRRVGPKVAGLLLHLGRATAEGFQIIEVWESRELWQRYNDELVGPVTAEVTGGQAPPGDVPAPEELEVRGLVIPSADIAF